MAISKERLEELIGQQKTIWSSTWEEEIKLNPETCTIKDVYTPDGEFNRTRLFVREDENHCPVYNIANLEEDVELSKFKLGYQNITRTETLSFIPYEDLDGSQYSVWFTKKNSLTQSELLVDDGWVSVINWDISYRRRLSKETYIEACKICKKLFLGEEL